MFFRIIKISLTRLAVCMVGEEVWIRTRLFVFGGGLWVHPVDLVSNICLLNPDQYKLDVLPFLGTAD
jgi:hypothetical protein